MVVNQKNLKIICLLRELDDINSIKINYETKPDDTQNKTNPKPELYFPIIYENEGSFLEMSRITNINHDLLNCNYINNMPLVQWNYLNRENIDSSCGRRYTWNKSTI